MTMYRLLWIFIILIGLPELLFAQDRNAVLGGEGYRENQYPGLSESASKIFFSDSWLTFSGYLELNQIIPLKGARDRSSEEIELYYSDLYRFSPFLGLRIFKNVVFTTEIQFEYFRDNDRESEVEWNPEFYFDILFSPKFNVRAGIFPLAIGYINNNEEPILFYSVNRPDVERLIIPTGWNETGIGIYGALGDNFHYFLNFTNGLEAKKFKSATWIRGGREVHFNIKDISINPQVNYLGLPYTTLSLSGYYGNTGQNEKITINNEVKEIKAPVSLLSGYARFDYHGLRLIGMGVVGQLSETDKIAVLTENNNGNSQVIGEKVYGYYLEAGYDILKLIFNNKQKVEAFNHNPNRLFRRENAKFSVFARYERLDTHASIISSLQGLPNDRQNLDIVVCGLNYEPSDMAVIKINYKYLNNRNKSDFDENLLEVGIGVSF